MKTALPREVPLFVAIHFGGTSLGKVFWGEEMLQ